MQHITFDAALLLVQTVPGAAAVFDYELKYLAHNRRWTYDYGLQDQPSILNRCHYEVFPEIPERWKIHHQRVLKGEVLSSEIEIASKDDAFARRAGNT